MKRGMGIDTIIAMAVGIVYLVWAEVSENSKWQRLDFNLWGITTRPYRFRGVVLL